MIDRHIQNSDKLLSYNDWNRALYTSRLSVSLFISFLLYYYKRFDMCVWVLLLFSCYCGGFISFALSIAIIIKSLIYLLSFYSFTRSFNLYSPSFLMCCCFAQEKSTYTNMNESYLVNNKNVDFSISFLWIL